MIYEDDTMPYKKRAKHKVVHKANHKHEYQPCVFEHDGGRRLDSAHGFVQMPCTSIGTYCKVCGKVGTISTDEWWRWVSGRPEYTEEAKREVDTATRTLPTFRLDDWISQKYVCLDGGEQHNA